MSNKKIITLEHVDLELTNYCNLSCWMCPRNKMERKIGYIKMDLVEKIAKELGEIGIKTMNLHLFGESILHPKLREILECLKQHNPSVWLSFSTNATFLSEKRFNKLANLLDPTFRMSRIVNLEFIFFIFQEVIFLLSLYQSLIFSSF